MKFFDIVAPLYGKLHLGDQKTFKTLAELGDFKKTDKVLDLGGGTGRVAKFFVGRVDEIVVVDPSLGMIQECKMHKWVKCLVGTAENIPFANDYFDKVIIVDAFHHFLDQKKAILEISRVLKEEGQLIIEEVNFGRVGNWFLEKLEALIGAKSKIFLPQSLAELFSKNKFRVKLFNKNKGGYYLIAINAKH